MMTLAEKLMPCERNADLAAIRRMLPPRWVADYVDTSGSMAEHITLTCYRPLSGGGGWQATDVDGIRRLIEILVACGASESSRANDDKLFKVLACGYQV